MLARSQALVLWAGLLASSTAAAVSPLAEHAVPLGQPLRQDGYWVRPPAGFRVARADLFHSTRAGAVSDRDDLSRRLSAALVDGDTEDAASMLVALVERSFKPSSVAKDELAAKVVKHFTDELGVPFAIEQTELVSAPGTNRVEVTGTVRDGSQLRKVLVVAFAGETRHVVVTFSAPAGRWAELALALHASIESFRMEPTAVASASRTVAMAVAALVASALLFSVGLWRRRRSATSNGEGVTRTPGRRSTGGEGS